MSGTLEGQSAIVTGAAQGIGAGFAEVLAEEGATVTLCDVKEAVLDVAAGIQEGGGSAQALVADVSRREDVERVVAAAVGVGGGLDLLVNNAGRWTQSPVTDGWEKALADWDREDFWRLLAQRGYTPRGHTRPFVEEWCLRVVSGEPRRLQGADDTRELIFSRERQIKGALARCGNRRSREMWRGEAGLGRMDFRWTNASVVLADIAAGLAGRDA